MLLDLGLPSFNTLVINHRFSFDNMLTVCNNALVSVVTDCCWFLIMFCDMAIVSQFFVFLFFNWCFVCISAFVFLFSYSHVTGFITWCGSMQFFFTVSVRSGSYGTKWSEINILIDWLIAKMLRARKMVRWGDSWLNRLKSFARLGPLPW